MPKPLAYNKLYSLNAICPYFTMFPLEYPFRILQKFKKHSPVVFDPFCGRGTTIYASREMGFSSWGIDSSPIAVAIAKAKLASSKADEVLYLAEHLISKKPKYIPETEFFKYAYSKETLVELCSLREGLLDLSVETDASILLRASALGCLHGPLNKEISTSSYFSNQMPRTFSSKPDYSVKYWKQRDLLPPKVKIIDVLKRKLSRIHGLENVVNGNPQQITLGDSRLSESFNHIKENISLVITSPPYYGMNTYIQDHWLRMWFLGGPEIVNYSKQIQVDHKGKDRFIDSLAQVWKNISNSKAPDLHLFVRLGSINSVESNPRDIMRASLEEAGGWKLLSTRSAKDAHSGKRQADQMVVGSRAALEYDFHAIRS
jgi:hypothetical protein